MEDNKQQIGKCDSFHVIFNHADSKENSDIFSRMIAQLLKEDAEWTAIHLDNPDSPEQPEVHKTCVELNAVNLALSNHKRCRKISGFPSPKKTFIPKIQLERELTGEDGVPIKPDIVKEVRHVRRKVVRQFFYAILRNVLCWLFVGGIIGVAVLSTSGHAWLRDYRVIVLILIVFGMVGIPFQIYHVYHELINRRPSAIAWMLRHVHEYEEFKKIIRERQASPPYLAVEIALKSGAIAQNKEDSHWMRASKKNTKILNYTTWTDSSTVIPLDAWKEPNEFWIIVSKDYRFLNKDVEATTNNEVAQFKIDCEFDKFMYFMTFQYVLDVQEGDFFPDAEPCLVFKKQKPILYKWLTYKAFLFIAVDSIYQSIFFIRTKFSSVYYFRKFIER